MFNDSKIKVVKKEWIEECYKKQKKVDTGKFLVKNIFYGLKLGLHGFG